MESEPIALTYSREFVSIRGSKKRSAHNLVLNRMIANLREARDMFREKGRSRGIFERVVINCAKFGPCGSP